jgi:capsular polysaccharide biosynthesis protein
MGPHSRRVLVLAIAVGIACALGIAWLRRALSTPTVEDKAREKAVEMQEKAREMTR